jgi:endonuclease/exonuclease/phosphatase family metal-dependent hydrolase
VCTGTSGIPGRRAGRANRAGGFLCLLFFSCTVLVRCTDPTGVREIPPDSILVMSYNLENLFDDVYDGTEYPEYNPGTESWSAELFHTKLENLTEVVRKAAKGGPDIIGVQEVENRETLLYWVENYLSKKGYKEVLVADSPGQAVNVGLISRYPVVSATSHQATRETGRSLRSILEATIDCNGEKVTVFVNHWPSKYGGAAATEEGRRAAAGVVQDRVSAILASDPSAQVIVMGDLNLNHDEYRRVNGEYQTALIGIDDEYPPEYRNTSLFVTRERDEAGLYGDQLILYSPWYSTHYPGSYMYQDEWETIDHFLLSPGLLNRSGFRKKSFRVMTAEFLLTPWGEPDRWFSSRASGYSDHLPLLLTLSR